MFSILLTLFAIFPFAIPASPSQKASPSQSPFPSPSPTPSPSSHGFKAELIPSWDKRSPFYHVSAATDVPTKFHLLTRHEMVVMEFDLGFRIPPRRMYAVADTGSMLSWVQCLPCIHCFNQSVPIFDPIGSRGREIPMKCTEAECRKQGVHTYCTESKNCGFSVSYGDGSTAKGELVPLWFMAPVESSYEQHINLGWVDFGCGHDNYITEIPHNTGIIGLNLADSSLVRQLNYTRFSYCQDKNFDSRSWIMFGQYANLAGNIRIPVIPNNFYQYHIHVIGIKVGSVQLDIKNYFEIDPSSYVETGMIFDSGTSITVLPKAVMDQLVQENKKVVTVQEIHWDGLTFQCAERGLFTFWFLPTIVFQFEGGATLELPRENVWFTHINYYCLAFRSFQGEKGVSILGNYNVYGFNIGFDLDRMEIVIDERGCST